MDLNEQLRRTFIIVTHDIATATRVADYIGMLYRRNLVRFGPAKEMFDSEIPVVRQFLAGDTEGPIGMSEEKDRRSHRAARHRPRRTDEMEGPRARPMVAAIAGRTKRRRRRQVRGRARPDST